MRPLPADPKNQITIFQNGLLDPPVSYVVLHGGYDDLEVGDVNNDGLTDIIVMSGQNYNYDNVGILLQNAGGGFSLPVYYDLEGNEPFVRGVAVGDTNGDALEDVVITYGGNSPSSFIGIFAQTARAHLILLSIIPPTRSQSP